MMNCQCLNSRQKCGYCNNSMGYNENINQVQQTQRVLDEYSYYYHLNSIPGSSNSNQNKNIYYSFDNKSNYIEQQQKSQSSLLSPIAFSKFDDGNNNSVAFLPTQSQNYAHQTPTSNFCENIPMSSPMSMYSTDSSYYETQPMSPPPAIDYENESLTSRLNLYQNNNYAEISSKYLEQENYKTSHHYYQHYQIQSGQNEQHQHQPTNSNTFLANNNESQYYRHSGPIQQQHENPPTTPYVPERIKECNLPQSKAMPASSLSGSLLKSKSNKSSSPSLSISNDINDASGKIYQEIKKGVGSSSGKLKKQPPQFRCSICFKSFTRAYNLRSHENSHSNERPYSCAYEGCDWKFTRCHDLKRHIQCLHTDIKPHKCGCGKTFSRSDALKRHLLADNICSQSEKNMTI